MAGVGLTAGTPFSVYTQVSNTNLLTSPREMIINFLSAIPNPTTATFAGMLKSTWASNEVDNLLGTYIQIDSNLLQTMLDQVDIIFDFADLMLSADY